MLIALYQYTPLTMIFWVSFIDNTFYYDTTLPFGLSPVGQLFEKFSSAMHLIVNTTFSCQFFVHILDDLLWGPPKTLNCHDSLS